MGRSNTTRLTDKYIRSLTPPAKGNVRYTDSEVPGFAARITSTGVIAFVLEYRLDGRNRRGTLARWPEYNASAARNLAIKYRGKISEGIDPFESTEVTTLEELSQDYIAHITGKKRKSREGITKDRQILNRLVLMKPLPGYDDDPKPRKLKTLVAKLSNNAHINKITVMQIEKLHISLSDTPYQANRVLALLSTMFNHAVKWGLMDKNPCQGVDKYTEQPRERYLDKAELKRLIEVLDHFKDRNIASALVLMMLTGCRKTEALSATWDQFALEEGVWTKPSHHTKQKRVHRVPLNPAAVALLEGLPHKGDYVFPGRVKDQPLQDIKKAWEAIRVDAEIPDVRMHDLRHTYASLLASQNLSLPVIGALLGHTQAQTTMRYAHLLDAPLREATNGAGALIEGVRK